MWWSCLSVSQRTKLDVLIFWWCGPFRSASWIFYGLCDSIWNVPCGLRLLGHTVLNILNHNDPWTLKSQAGHFFFFFFFFNQTTSLYLSIFWSYFGLSILKKKMQLLLFSFTSQRERESPVTSVHRGHWSHSCMNMWLKTKCDLIVKNVQGEMQKRACLIIMGIICPLIFNVTDILQTFKGRFNHLDDPLSG